MAIQQKTRLPRNLSAFHSAASASIFSLMGSEFPLFIKLETDGYTRCSGGTGLYFAFGRSGKGSLEAAAAIALFGPRAGPVLHDKRWISNHHRIGRNILPNDAARPQNRSLSDVYTGENDDASANPNIVFNTNRPNLPKTLKDHGDIGVCCPMVSAEKFNVRPNHNIVADCNGSIGYTAITQAGAVPQRKTRGKVSAAVDINLLAAVR
nr:hypothetical protein [uncultured Oscillibacter sp.]